MTTHQRQHGEVNRLPSLTVPDQTPSVREILNKYVNNGGVVPGVPWFEPVYNEHLPPGVENLDKLQKLDLASQIRANLHEAQKFAMRAKEDEAKNSTSEEGRSLPTD